MRRKYLVWLGLYCCFLFSASCYHVTCEDHLDRLRKEEYQGLVIKKYTSKMRPTPVLELQLDGGKVERLYLRSMYDTGLWDTAAEGDYVSKARGSLEFRLTKGEEESYFTMNCK